MHLNWETRLQITIEVLEEMLFNEEMMQFTAGDDSDIRPALCSLLEYCCRPDELILILDRIEAKLKLQKAANDPL